MVPQDPGQVSHVSGTKLEISRLERQPMLKNPPQIKDKKGEKYQEKGETLRKRTKEIAEDSWNDDVPRTQHDRKHEGDEWWGHNNENPFGIHPIQVSNRDEHEAGALFIHEEEERQNKHNKKPEEISS